jgi:hypothetical protein
MWRAVSGCHTLLLRTEKGTLIARMKRRFLRQKQKSTGACLPTLSKRNGRQVYTHVSTKSLQKIKSPFDDL